MMILYNHGRLSVRLLTEDDATLLAKWLTDPCVLQYYEGRDRPHDLELVKQHFYDRTQDITQCIVQYDKTDIGYIQFYFVPEDERHEYGYDASHPGRMFGMDQFIGEVDYWNQGIGTQLVKSMVNYLVTHEDADVIVMDPQTWNLRAMHVYEKCGFVKKWLLPKHEWHEGEYRDCWVVEYTETMRRTSMVHKGSALLKEAYLYAAPKRVIKQFMEPLL